MPTPQEARSFVVGRPGRLAPVEPPVADASGAVPAKGIAADRGDPPTDRSGIDGYAVRLAGLASMPVTFSRRCGAPGGGLVGFRPWGGATIPVRHDDTPQPLSLRLSVTDRCQMRCRYCTPCGAGRSRAPAETLTSGDMATLVACLQQEFGVAKVRLTGGAPPAPGRAGPDSENSSPRRVRHSSHHQWTPSREY